MLPSISRVGSRLLQHAAARVAQPTGTVLAALLVGASYYVGSEVGFAVRFPSIPTSIVWPPNSILMAALMLTPARRWWPHLLTALIAHLLIQSQTAVPPPTMLLLFLTNAGEAALGAYAVRRLCGGRPRFSYVRDVVVFLAFAVFAAPFVTSFPDAATVVLTKWSDNYSLVWQARFLSNVLTILTLVPAIVLWTAHGRAWLRGLTLRRFAEVCLVGLGLGVTYAVAYSESSFGPSFGPALLYAPLPFLIWAALRFGAGGASTSLLAVLLISVSYAIGGSGPFTSRSPAEDVVGLQLFLIAISVPMMVLAAVTEERRRAAEALSRSEEFNRQIVESISESIKILDLEGNLLYISPKGQVLLGIGDLRPYLNTPWVDLWEDEGREAAREAVACAKAGEVCAFQSFRRTPRGELKWWDTLVTPMKDACGNVERLLCVSRDITEQWLAEEALKESEAQLAGIVGLAMDGIITVDESQRIVLFNAAAERIFGCPASEALGQTLDRFIPERFRQAHGTHVRLFGEAAETQRLMGSRRELYGLRESGEEFPLEASISRLELNGQRFFTVILRDITERKQAENALRESESRLRLAQLAARVGTWEWDIGTGAAVWSEMTWHLFGLEPGDGAASFKRFVDFIHPEDRASALRKVDEALAGGEDYENEFRLVRSDGRVLCVASKGRVIRSAAGQPERMLGVNIDVTERKRAEQSLEQLTGRLLQLQDEERRRIARELHDTTAQNLLAIVINLETLVQKASVLPKDFVDAVAECQSLCQQTQSEIRTLSYLLHPPLLDEAGLILALEWFIDGFSKRSGIQVDFSAPPGFRRLPTQMETALFRIVQESLTNIYRHSGSTTAEIRLERGERQVRLQVTDRGRGIAASGNEVDLTARRTETLGVGISGMRERLRQLGGLLEVHSNGAGTCVRAVLPLENGGEDDKHHAGRRS